MIFLVLGGSFGSYILKIWLRRNDEIEHIRQTGNNAREYLELKEKHQNLMSNFSMLKQKYRTLKNEEIDLEDLDIDEDDEDDVKISKLAKSFGIPKPLADALDNSEFQEGVGQILKKNSKPVLALVDNWLSQKSGNDQANISNNSYGV